MALKEGWRGRFYEDFEVGDVYPHPLGRTITRTDNIWFTLLTQNTAPIHFDAHYSAQTEFKRPLVDSTFTLALVTGQSVIDVSQNVFANLGWDEIRLPHPVFEGDTLYSQSEVLEKRESRSRPNVGIVTVRTTGYNQDGVVVITFKRTLLVYKRGQAARHPAAQARARVVKARGAALDAGGRSGPIGPQNEITLSAHWTQAVSSAMVLARAPSTKSVTAMPRASRQVPHTPISPPRRATSSSMWARL